MLAYVGLDAHQQARISLFASIAVIFCHGIGFINVVLPAMTRTTVGAALTASSSSVSGYQSDRSQAMRSTDNTRGIETPAGYPNDQAGGDMEGWWPEMSTHAQVGTTNEAKVHRIDPSSSPGKRTQQTIDAAYETAYAQLKAHLESVRPSQRTDFLLGYGRALSDIQREVDHSSDVGEEAIGAAAQDHGSEVGPPNRYHCRAKGACGVSDGPSPKLDAKIQSVRQEARRLNELQLKEMYEDPKCIHGPRSATFKKIRGEFLTETFSTVISQGAKFQFKASMTVSHTETSAVVFPTRYASGYTALVPEGTGFFPAFRGAPTSANVDRPCSV